MTEVRLLAPTLDDRRRVYDWMTAPGIVERMMGPPEFPDSQVPSFDEFVDDWLPHFWTHESPERGRGFLIEHRGDQVGFVAHNDLVATATGERATELDMWLRGAGDTGHGIGPAAIQAMVERLVEDLGVEVAFLQPSGRNRTAIRAYEKAGFSRVPMRADEAAEHFGTQADYRDTIFLVRRIA